MASSTRPANSTGAPSSEARPLRALADDDQASPGNGAATDGLDGRLEAHPVAEAPDGDHEEGGVRVDAELSSRRGLVTGHEAIGVHPRRDPPDHRRVDPVAIGHHRLEGAREHDDPVGPPVDSALDQPLDPRVDAAAALRGALIGPRALEVDDERATSEATEQRPERVEGEVGIDDVGERPATGNAAHRHQPPPDGNVLGSRPDQSRARCRTIRPQHHALGVEVHVTLSHHEVGEVPVEPTRADGRVLEADVPDGEPAHRVMTATHVMRPSNADGAASPALQPAPGPPPPPSSSSPTHRQTPCRARRATTRRTGHR